MYDLIIFDVDGTIAERDTGRLLPNVSTVISGLSCKIAFATNQGGPACHDAGFRGDYPTLATVEQKYTALAERFGARLYMSLVYLSKNGDVYVPAGLSADDPRLNPEWRKPRPGMLFQAMKEFGVAPHQTLMVGDRWEDEQAAMDAGCAFEWAYKFFMGNEHLGITDDLIRAKFGVAEVQVQKDKGKWRGPVVWFGGAEGGISPDLLVDYINELQQAHSFCLGMDKLNSITDTNDLIEFIEQIYRVARD